jgi:hypothetical protein
VVFFEEDVELLTALEANLLNSDDKDNADVPEVALLLTELTKLFTLVVVLISS